MSREYEERPIELHMLGSDPEFFLQHNGTGEIVSATDLIGGTKEKPIQLENGSVLEDGVTAEINPNPASTREEFIDNTQSLLKELHDYLKGTFSFIFKDTHQFNMDYLEDIGPKAFLSGCEPFKVYENYEETFNLIDYGGHRFAGGHIHLSFTEPRRVNHIRLLSYLDKSLIQDTYMNKGFRGNTILSSPGAHRPKVYGLEYRTLGNGWLSSSEYIGHIWDSVQRSINCYNTNTPNRLTKPYIIKHVPYNGGV